MTEETKTEWVEFEAWIDQTSICGYIDVDDADDEAPLQFYGYDGLECGTHISNTRYPSYSEEEEYKWDKLCYWFMTTDVVQHLVDFKDEDKILVFNWKDEYDDEWTVELYVNCSKVE